MNSLANLEGQGRGDVSAGVMNFTSGAGGTLTVPKGKYKLVCDVGNEYRADFTVNGIPLNTLGVDLKSICGSTYGLYVSSYELKEGDVLMNNSTYALYQVGYISAGVMFRVNGTVDEWV